MVDTHCHLNFRAFKEDASEVIARAQAAGVNSIINVGSQWETSERAVKMADESARNLYATIALHPIHLFEQEVDEEEVRFKTKAEEFETEKYKTLASSSKRVVAIGECGLDYYRFPPKVDRETVKSEQRELFRQHIILASELNLPIIIHCREAYDDLLDILKSELAKGALPKRGVSHCFLGNRAQAERFIDLGFYISFTGIITFKNVGAELLEVVKQVPLEKILTETDAPYLAPEPHRGKRNEPSFVVEVARKIAEVKGVSLEQVDQVTTQNANFLFGLDSAQ